MLFLAPTDGLCSSGARLNVFDNIELIGGDWVLENTDIRLPL